MAPTDETANPQLSESEDLISTLPREDVRMGNGLSLYKYQGFWYLLDHLQSLISFQNNFQAQDSDIFLVSTPKSGTTWLKAIMFALLNRNRHPPTESDHPLLRHSPHVLVPFLEIDLYANNQIPDMASFPTPRMMSTHSPFVSLPESVKINDACKIVYLCRNVKDIFASYRVFSDKLHGPSGSADSKADLFADFCDGITAFGPFWDHVLGYWNQSKVNPEKFFFLTFEDMKEKPEFELRRLGDFLECPISEVEERSGTVAKILELCSFASLSGLDVNKNGRLSNGAERSSFFRRGEVGDWKNHLSDVMAEKLDKISESKFKGSGLVLS